MRPALARAMTIGRLSQSADRRQHEREMPPLACVRRNVLPNKRPAATRLPENSWQLKEYPRDRSPSTSTYRPTSAAHSWPRPAMVSEWFAG